MKPGMRQPKKVAEPLADHSTLKNTAAVSTALAMP
jgi:hypothetical protein